MIGWIGNIALAICGAPQAYKSFKDGHSDGISTSFIILWTTGELCTFVYILKDISSWPLILNYSANGLFCSIILYYKLRRRK